MESLNKYKKVITKDANRLKILRLLSFIPTKFMLKIQFRIKFKKKLNFKNPKRYTEKIQKYKLEYKNKNMITCADKYEVRKYVKAKGYENILINNHGVYSSYKDINFDKLPKQFVLKSTNGAGAKQVIVIKNKDSIDFNKLKKEMKTWTKTSSKRHGGREYSYHRIKGRIIADELIISDNPNYKKLEDYKFFCFNGKAKVVKLIFREGDLDEGNFYDMNWNHLCVESDDKFNLKEIKKPENFEKMIEIAEKLSEEFPHVRVDMYNVNGKIYFGEMTFYPWSGYVKFKPDAFDYKLGEFFNI